jgi:hypothetical protein
MLAVLASVSGCSEDFWLGKKRYLSVEQTAGVVSPKSSEYAGERFYLVQVVQLGELRRRASLTYLGTDERFHYLRVWNKAARDREVQYVALSKPDCQVSDAAPIESEVAYKPEHFTYHPWRHVDVGGSVCIVRSRSEQLSVRGRND